MLLVFVPGQVYVGVSFAEPGAVVPGESVTMTPKQPMGILTTQGNNEITVNDTYSTSGATILSRARIETPAGVSAIVSLGSRGTLEIQPNTKLTVEFDQSTVKAVLTEGCVNLRAKKGTTGEVVSPKGSTGKTDPSQDDKVETCPPRRTEAIVEAGVGADGLFRLGTAAAVAIIAGGVTSVAVPVTPRGVLY